MPNVVLGIQGNRSFDECTQNDYYCIQDIFYNSKVNI